MNKSKRAKQWPSIYTQTNRSGQPTYYVDLRRLAQCRLVPVLRIWQKQRQEPSKPERSWPTKGRLRLPCQCTFALTLPKLTRYLLRTVSASLKWPSIRNGTLWPTSPRHQSKSSLRSILLTGLLTTNNPAQSEI
jgi:hypothetical protein